MKDEYDWWSRESGDGFDLVPYRWFLEGVQK